MFADIPKAPDIWNLETVEDLTKEVGTFPLVGFKQGGPEYKIFQTIDLQNSEIWYSHL